MSRAIRAKLSLATNARIIWPLRTRAAPKSTEASSHASWIHCGMRSLKPGVRELPLFSRSRAAAYILSQAVHIDLIMGSDLVQIGVVLF